MPRKKSTHVDDSVSAGLRLREARRRAGLSQRQLAFHGCSAAYISRIEAGERIGSRPVLRELARRLRVSEEYLATGADVAPTLALDDAEIALRLDEVEEAAGLFKTALEDAHDDRERTRVWEGLGQVAVRSGDPELAVDLFERALSLAGDDISERPALAESLARAYASLGQLARSISVLERCIEAYADDPVQYVRFAGLLGAALTDNGSFPEAERVLAAALSRGRKVADPYTRARLYWSESRLRVEQGQSELAARYAQKTLEILRTTEDNYAIAHVLQSLAHTYLDLGRAEEALELLREGKELIMAAGTPLEIAQYRIEEARALAALGEGEAAAALAMEAGNELRGIEPVDGGRAYALLGGIYADLGDVPRAQEILELAVDLLEQQAPSRYLVQAYKRLAGLLRSEGDAEAALSVLERALGVQERVGRPLA
ncbi:MAG: tetratricopeptide repeat protein [Dehalococcoidia bacterium]